MIEGLSDSGGGLGPFGKGLKQGKTRDLLSTLFSLGGMGEDEEDLSSFLSRAKPGSASPPMYDPQQLYGKLYSMYGGQKVRGGLLGS
jgi:hypothetical protein